MRNQFIYTEKVHVPATDTEEAYVVEIKNSFNVDKVIRAVTLDTKQVLILLDDLHERTENVPKIKNGKRTTVREKNAFQSEIFLSPKDAERFFTLTNIETKK